MLLLRSLLLAAALLAWPAPPPSPPPTLTLHHLGPNTVPGPWVVALSHSGAAEVALACRPGPEAPWRPVGAWPTPNRPTVELIGLAVPPCPPGSQYQLTLTPWGDQGVRYGPPATFGPLAETAGAWPRAAPARHAVALPLVRR